MNDSSGPSQAGFFALLHGAGAVQEFVESRLAAVDLSMPKLAALHRLMESGGSLPLGQLAERLACVKSNVTQLVDRLEADGLVERTPDPSDRRSRLAVITTKGKRAFEDGGRIQQTAEQELFGGLTHDEARQLTTLLEKVQERAK